MQDVAQDVVNVLEGRVRPGVRARVHWQALMADVDEHVWRRRLKLRALRSREDWQRHVAQVRARFRTALGPLPERSPLHVTCTGTLAREGYVIEKLLVETQPGFVAPAHLYLPARLPGRAPAVLNAVGHWAHSKAEDVEQARMVGLARKGYVALIWDPLGQGERGQYWDESSGAPWNAPSTSQHAAVCNPAFLVGSTVVATMLWDGVRMLDYLLSRPEVDADRAGCTGVSGGGTYTTFLGAFDDRLKATVPVCSTSTYERMHRQGQIGDPCQDPVRSYPDDLDVADLLLSHAPAALLVAGTRYDTFPLGGLREAFLDVQDAYAALGIPDKAALRVVDAHHDYNREQREVMYAWFNRWLEHDAPVPEEPFVPERTETLWCTATGQVLTSLPGSKTAPDLVRDLAAQHIPAPAPVASQADAAREQARVRSAVLRVLGPLPPLNGAPPVMCPPATLHGLPVERLILQARMDVPLPALLFRPPGAGPLPLERNESPAPTPSTSQAAAGDAGRSLTILLDDRGKAPECAAGGLAPAIARAGGLALAVDVRGWGETAWINRMFDWSQDRRHLLSADNMLAYVGYMLGHWSVTQRVQDVLGVLRYVRSRPDVDRRRITLAGRGGGAIVALHAAAVDGGVAGVVAYDALATYRSIVDSPRYVHPVADFLPEVLLHYDLPDLAAALAPARALVMDPQDAMGQPFSPAAAVYARPSDLAAQLGGELRVITSSAPAGRADEMARWVVAQRAAT